MTAAFQHSTIPHNGKRVRGFIATCGHCGVSGTAPVNSFRIGASTEQEYRFVAKKFEERGWKVGGAPSGNRCPGCFNAIKNAAVRKKQEKENMENTVVKLPSKAEAPATMGRDDRRIIFEKLNEVYADEKSGYLEGWTDAKVAGDLGVPRDWVRQVRDEMFGPEGNEEIKKAVCECVALIDQVNKFLAGGELMKQFSMLSTRAEKMEKTLIDIQKSLR